MKAEINNKQVRIIFTLNITFDFIVSQSRKDIIFIYWPKKNVVKFSQLQFPPIQNGWLEAGEVNLELKILEWEWGYVIWDMEARHGASLCRGCNPSLAELQNCKKKEHLSR